MCVVVLPQPLQCRFVGVELGLNVGRCQEPPFPPVQGLRKPRAVKVERDSASRPSQSEAEGVGVPWQLVRWQLVSRKEVCPFLHVVVAEKVKGL